MEEPPLQPFADLYQSPLTIEVTMELSEIQRNICDMFTAFKMTYDYNKSKFKYYAMLCTASGWTRMTARIWYRSTGKYAVELLRERGDRPAVSILFQKLSALLSHPDQRETYLTYNDKMFDWALPELLPASDSEDDEEEEEPHHHYTVSALSALIEMISSGYDDITVNGMQALIKLLGNSKATRQCFSKSYELCNALLDIVTGDLSLDAKTNAALALSIITSSTNGISSVCFCKDHLPLDSLVTQCTRSCADAHYELLMHRRFVAETLVNICKSEDLEVQRAVSSLSELIHLAFSCNIDFAYVPLQTVCRKGLEILKK